MTSHMFGRCHTLYRECEERLKDETTILGAVGAPSAFFDEWRKLFSAMCRLEERYQFARRARRSRKVGRR